MEHAGIRTQALNPAKLAALFHKQLQMSEINAGDTIALISDLGTRPAYIEAAFAAADVIGADIYEMKVNSMPVWTKVGVPTVGKVKGTLDALMKADLIIIFHPPLFASWLGEVLRSGTRVLMVIDAPDELEQLFSPLGLKEAVLYAEERVKSTKKFRVVSEAGTDFVCNLGDYRVLSWYGYADRPGKVDQWGTGHVNTFPNEGSANGKVVIQPGDILVLPYCRYVVDRVELDIRDGFITNISGGLDAKLMEEWLIAGQTEAADRDPWAVSHIGWGMNPQADWYGIALNGDVPERSHAAARAFSGNFLFSTGPNSLGGGKRHTRGHLDIPMRDCTISLDNDVIVERGKIIDPKMIVKREPR
ncbi:MAG TPA: hypothetical protein VJM81_09755 [Rhizorhapis sp.]|nr:hypothetical protein [Rhizorhapis sp.]